VTLSPEHKKQLSRIAKRLLNLRSGTPAETLRKELGPSRKVLDDMSGTLLRFVGNQYLPTFRGIEQLDDDDIRAIVRRNLNWALHALKRLYRASEGNAFTFAAILEEIRTQNPTLDANDVIPALLLGEQFRGYYSLSGVHQREDRLSVEAAMVADGILDFTSVEDAWAQMLAQEEAQRQSGAAAKATGPTTGLQRPAVAQPSFQFMGRADLRKIVERDYAELQRVKAVSAPKSRYVLCGGLIEALLLDALSADEPKAKAASKAPKLKGGSQAKPLPDWNLGELIDVASELRIIETDTEQFSHGVRNYRNLIHPGKETQSKQRVAGEEADIGEKVLEIVIRELRQERPLRP
jgi:hypothetical protein